jgi:hypothetical protein
MPYNYELCGCLSKESEPHARHRQDQGSDGASYGLGACNGEKLELRRRSFQEGDVDA